MGNKITQRDGERLIAENIQSKGEYLAFLKHLFAYDLLKKYKSSDKCALEIGFGSGYGSDYAAPFFKTLDCVEVDDEAVRYAQATYKHPNLTFKQFNGARLPYADDTFDVVYSFQVIEHVPKDDEFLKEAKRVLRPNGVLIITTPNRLYRLKDGEKPRNRFHLREYSPSQLKDVVLKVFPKTTLQGVKGVGEVHQYELDRVKAGLGKYDPLRIRDHLPESIKAPARKIIRGILGKKTKALPDDFKTKYTLNDYFVEATDINSTLDLLAVCEK